MAVAPMKARAALLRPSTASFLYPKYCPNLQFSPVQRISLCSSSHQTLGPQPQLAIPNVVDILRERGLIDSISSENLRSVCSVPLKVYCDFDPTAESLHLGNLIGIIVLSWFRRCGHETVVLIDSATGRIGDPLGKIVERPELDVETIKKNSAEIRASVYRIIHRVRKCPPEDEILKSDNKGSCNCLAVLDNYDWWKDITLLDFLRDAGRYARVGTMMAKESLKKCLLSEEEMNSTEFIYQLLRGYDFLHMFKNLGVNVQIGRSDQCGNITAGTELIRKILQVEGAYGLTFPLLLKSHGSKFGKSPAMLSPYKCYQYFCSVPDVDVVRFMKILTFLNLEEIHKLEEGMGKPGYDRNSAQRRLAEEVTLFIHGEEGLSEVLRAKDALKLGTETEFDPKIIEETAKDVSFSSVI